MWGYSNETFNCQNQILPQEIRKGKEKYIHEEFTYLGKDYVRYVLLQIQTFMC